MGEKVYIKLQHPPDVQYLLPREQSFWRWSDDGRTIEWRDGRTIAFREEIVTVLRRLGPAGLPPFGAIVILLAATRENWNQIEDKPGRILAGYSSASTGLQRGDDPARPVQVSISTMIPQRARQELSDVIGDLEAVASLADEVRTSAAAKSALAELVFDGLPAQLHHDFAEKVIAHLTGGIEIDLLKQTAGHDDNYEYLAADLDALRSGLGRVATEPLSLWMKTGIDRDVEPAELELPPAQRVRGLLRELRADAELGGLAKLAQDLLAAMHIPRVLVSPEDLPVGGVSDIANRGPLDRLLLSELAHDDLTLAVRVAVGEALYLRRESPAQHPPIGRAILIDCGIRLWGVPRLFATSVAMALIASSDAHAPVFVHRTCDGASEPADLLSKRGVRAHLEALDAAPHPGARFPEFLEAIERQSVEKNLADCEVFLVTQEDVLADPDFARALHLADGGREWRVASVGRDGTFILWLLSSAGRRELCRAKLSLDDLLAPARPMVEPVPLVVGRPELPHILALRSLPLLLPATPDYRHVAASDSLGMIGITTDRRLMRWLPEQKGVGPKGAEELTAALPAGRIEGVFVEDETELVHVVTTENPGTKLSLLTYGVNDQGCQTQSFKLPRPRGVFARDNQIFLVYEKEIRAISGMTWQERTIALPDDMRWQSGRFFHKGHVVYALHNDGFEQVCARSHVYGTWDRRAIGPWVLLSNGDVAPADGDVFHVEKPHGISTFLLQRASSDGSRMVTKTWGNHADGGGYFGLHLDGPLKWERLHGEQVHSFCHRSEKGFASSCSSGVTIRNHFSAMSVRREDDLVLGALGFTTSAVGYFHLEMRDPGDSEHTRSVVLFGATRPPPGVRYTLKVAQWKDGSRAYLDSRGMLHLISSDPTLPQITLTLNNGALAGWTSKGASFGSPFFFRDRPSTPVEVGFRLIGGFARRLS